MAKAASFKDSVHARNGPASGLENACFLACSGRVQTFFIICNSICPRGDPASWSSYRVSLQTVKPQVTLKKEDGVQQGSDFCSAKTQSALKPHVAEGWLAGPSVGSDGRP